jgi:hypothetical protein
MHVLLWTACPLGYEAVRTRRVPPEKGNRAYAVHNQLTDNSFYLNNRNEKAAPVIDK